MFVLSSEEFGKRYRPFVEALNIYADSTTRSYLLFARRFVSLVSAKERFEAADISAFLSIQQGDLAGNEARAAYIRNALIAVRCFLKATGHDEKLLASDRAHKQVSKRGPGPLRQAIPQ